MHGIGSDSSESDARERFTFGWRGPYGHVVKLVERLESADDGIVLNLGCGYGQIAGPLAERGITCVGAHFDAHAVAALVADRHEAHMLEVPVSGDAFVAQLERIVGDRPVTAVMLVDLLEYVTTPADIVAGLSRMVEDLGRPPVIVSVPNIAHYDIGAKLLAGRWDTTDGGLLDGSRVTHFTERRMLDLFADSGWRETERMDVALAQSDQSFPEGLPVLSWQTPIAQYLRRVRDAADDTGAVGQFVRVFEPASAALAPEIADEGPTPFLSVVVRTQGTRPGLLIETLTSLAAQTDQDFEVLLMVNARHPAVADEVEALVDAFDGSFAERVRVTLVAEPGRVAPLNTGLDIARGRYIAFLDDDDVAFAHWVEEFRRLFAERPDAVARCLTVQQCVEPGAGDSYVTQSYDVHWSAEFDLSEHLANNQTPFCSFAVPVDAVRALDIRFDPNLQVVEDWEFLLRSAIQLGVVSSTEYTTSYRWWSSGSSLNTVPVDVWDTCRRVILERLDREPLLLPPGSATTLADIWNTSQGVMPAGSVGQRILELETAVAQQAERLREYQRVVEGYERSASWKVTRPLRAATERLRERRGRAGRPDDAT